MTWKKNARAEPPARLETYKQVGPAGLRLVLNTAGAATAIDRSPSWLRQTRAADTKRLAQGLPPLGPRWLTLGANIVYSVADLEAWLTKTAVPFGRVAFRGTEAQS
jgi:hypothetical protein